MTKSKELCDETPLGLHFNSQNKTVRRGYFLYNEIRKEVDGIDGTDLRRRKRRILKKKIEINISNQVKALNRTDISLHMVFQEYVDDVYPINFLRNVAMNQSNCDRLIVVDVDFLIYGGY
uniref:Uncharacterized protein n=1 Tax=Caenorhabditis japonica TaxID=281687 RepID=A0A8R1HQP7_CAEJA